MRSLLLIVALSAASFCHAQEAEIPAVLAQPEPADMQSTAATPLEAPAAEEPAAGAEEQRDAMMDLAPAAASDSRFSEWLESMRVSLKHEASYKFSAPEHFVNNRSSVRLEYSKLWSEKFHLQLDTKLNLHWSADHVSKARDKGVYVDSITREAYVQSSFGNTSLRLGYQILVWGISEGGAITDEVSPRNASEFFFVSLEESRIGQPMLMVDQFGRFGEWSAFYVPRPAFNKYPDGGTEYYLPGVYGGISKPDRESSDAEYGMRWKRTFDKSDFALMVASLIDNDYLIRKQRFEMVGLTANIAQGNLLYRAEIGLKRPKLFFSRAGLDAPLSVVKSDQLDSSLGFDYTPGGGDLTFGAEFVRRRLLDWDPTYVGQQKSTDSFVASISSSYLNDDLSLTLQSIYNKPYSFQHKFLSSYSINDNTSLYFELFYPDERDARSSTFAYRQEKQVVFKFQYQF